MSSRLYSTPTVVAPKNLGREADDRVSVRKSYLLARPVVLSSIEAECAGLLIKGSIRQADSLVARGRGGIVEEIPHRTKRPGRVKGHRYRPRSHLHRGKRNTKDAAAPCRAWLLKTFARGEKSGNCVEDDTDPSYTRHLSRQLSKMTERQLYDVVKTKIKVITTQSICILHCVGNFRGSYKS